MTGLALGPILRGLGSSGVRVWVETDGPGEVEVLGRRTRTFAVSGHHYALVELDDLVPGTDEAYEVRFRGEVVWPEPGDDRPPPRIRSWDGDGPIRLVVGSCRQAAPPSWLDMLESEREPPGIGTDALGALARHLMEDDHEPVDGMLLLGDQVYADQPDPDTIEALRRRRGGPPEDGRPEVSGFEEYTWLYQEAWSDPDIRWLMATVPSVMIFDDHDVIDDWNTSAAWRREIEEQPWWSSRVRGGLMAYWVYQHLGNVGSTEPVDAELLDAVRSADDGEEVLGDLARRADAGTPDDVGHRWSFSCDLGTSRLLVVDSRNGRILEPGRRSMLGEAEWAWLDDRMTGDLDHLFLASSVPWLLPRPIHDLEAWDAALSDGAWGRVARRPAEWLRQYIDLEHWAAFGHSFEHLAELVSEVAAGDRGRPPETVTVLSGDVHFGYVAEADLGGTSRVRQVVSSPFRQAITTFDRKAQGAAMFTPVELLCRGLLATTPRARPRFDWRVSDGPWFDDHLAVLTVDGPSARIRYEAAGLDDADRPVLRPLHERSL